MLQAHDLAHVCGVCRELRHLAGHDVCWEPLFVSEFPSASPALHILAKQRGYRAAFVAAWRVRFGGGLSRAVREEA
jgi:hypothetical protein